MLVPKLRRAASKLVGRFPVYHVFPPGELRARAYLRYHQGAKWAKVAKVVRARGGIPTRPLRSALVLTRGAFQAGEDDLVIPSLDALEKAYPRSAAVQELRCDLCTFQGDLEEALRRALRARELKPTSATAVARVVKLSQQVREQAVADQEAVSAVRSFPRSTLVVSAACKAAASAEQFERLLATWREADPDPVGDLPRVVRQLANGAMRTGRLDRAAELYREVIGLIIDGRTTPRQFSIPTLQPHSAWAAMLDLNRVLESAGVPYFFAAGTVLGLIREGGPLPGDDDIDVGVLDRDWDRDALEDLFRNDPKFVVNFHPQTQKVGLNHRGGTRIDIFRFYSEAERIWHDGVFVRWHNTPFTVARRPFNGVELPVPEDAETYLTENYGDWRTPNPGFDAFTKDAPNVEVTWPEYLDIHLLRRAYRKLVAGDLAAAQADLRRVGEADLADRLRP